VNLSVEKRLREAGHSIEVPFSLSLEGSDDLLFCETLLRTMPGKRSVFRGRWGKQPVVAKLFYRPLQIYRHLRREVDGTEALLRAGIATACLLYAGKAVDTAITVLLFEYIPTNGRLQEVWNNPVSLDEKRAILQQFMCILAKMHEAGIKQSDLHLNNFLINDYTLYCMDGSTIKKKRSRRPLKRNESLNNLALLFAQLKLEDTLLMADVYPDYIRGRTWTDAHATLRELQLRTEYWRKKRIRKYLKKIFRESTEHICERSPGRFLLCRRANFTPDMTTFLNNPDLMLDGVDARLLKRGNTATVGRVRIDGQDLVVKRYNIKSLWHRLRRSCATTRAACSWRNSHLLLMLGIETARPVALLEKRCGPLRGRAYFVSEYIEGPHALAFFQDETNTYMIEVGRRIAGIFQKLRAARISHGDMKATNMIIRLGTPVLTDLDAMRFHRGRRSFASAQRKDMERFLHNWIDMPEVGRLFQQLLRQPAGMH
jgi:tRNA A-37 threonylcarbamoyl transferase component Bud32